MSSQECSSWRRRSDRRRYDTSALPSDFLVGYAPGQPPEILEPGQAKLVKAGSDFVLEIHYTTNGTAEHGPQQVRPGVREGATQRRVLTLSATNGKFKIPPGDPNYRVDAEFNVGATGEAGFACIRTCTGAARISNTVLVYPTGETETLLRVPQLQLALAALV